MSLVVYLDAHVRHVPVSVGIVRCVQPPPLNSTFQLEVLHPIMMTTGRTQVAALTRTAKLPALL